MEIRFDLSRHCIETAARLKVERLIRSYFKAQDPGTEDRITALTHFLEQADFQDLRNRINQITLALSPEAPHAVLVISRDLKIIEIRFNNQSIYPNSTI